MEINEAHSLAHDKISQGNMDRLSKQHNCLYEY